MLQVKCQWAIFRSSPPRDLLLFVCREAECDPCLLPVPAGTAGVDGAGWGPLRWCQCQAVHSPGEHSVTGTAPYSLRCLGLVPLMPLLNRIWKK